MMVERHLSVDPSTIWRWVQRYAPELNERIRHELKPTNGSWRTDETYVRVAGRWTYLYRAVDSTGATIDFFLSQTRDVFAAGAFFRKALAAPGHPRPRVINVDGNPSYPHVVDELKRTHALGQRCRCRVVPYLNNIVEQDHRAIKRRIQASLGFRSFAGAERTIQGYEAMHMIRKGQVRWLAKGDIAEQVRFIKYIFGLRAWSADSSAASFSPSRAYLQQSRLDVLKDLKLREPELPVLVLSMHPETQYGKRVLKAGASGYMNKDSAPDELINAIRKVMSGRRYVSPVLAEKLALDLALGAEKPPHERLSDREIEVLRMLASGKSVSQIAEILYLSVSTVSTYRARILEKLNLTTTAELMHYALSGGLIL
jgi:transposase, IS6 family